MRLLYNYKKSFIKKVGALAIIVSFLAQNAAAYASPPRSTLAPESIFKLIEESKDIGPVFDARRSLIVSDNVDAIDARLLTEAKRRGKKYLRLTLKDQSELDRLMTRVHIHGGAFDTRRGAIQEIVEDGGILLIDYNGSMPQFIEGFNSLFDKTPYFTGCAEVSNDLIVAGVVGEKQYLDSDSTFRSRFAKETSLEKTYRDPVSGIGPPPAGVSPLTVELYGTPQYREELLGRPYFDQNGAFRINEGPLVKALREKRPLLITGDSWNQPAFLHFIRQILLHREVEYNGETIPVPADFMICRGPGDYKSGVTNKKIVSAVDAAMRDEEVWVINEQNQDSLFSRTRLVYGKMTQLPGILDQPRVRLRVTGKLPEWVWHRIMHSPGEVEIETTPDCPIPAVYHTYRSEKLRTAVPKEKRKTWDAVKNEKTVFVEGADLGFIMEKLKQDMPGSVVFPVTPETSSDQLISSVEIEADEEKKPFFIPISKEVLRLLEQGRTVILEGIDANPALMAELETALCETPYIMDNGVRVDLSKLPGRLIATARPQEGKPVRAKNYVTMPPDDAAIAALLAKKFSGTFDRADYEKIKDMQKIFETIPAPSIVGLYPPAAALSFNRLCLLITYGKNLLRGIEEVFIPAYSGNPEIAAYMRVMARLKLGKEDPRFRRTIFGRPLAALMNRIRPPGTWEKSFWQFADTLSVDLLRELRPGDDYLRPNSAPLLRAIKDALIAGSEEERSDFYRHRFGIEGEIKNPPKINYEVRPGEVSWRSREKKIVRLMKKGRAVFLRGPPGTGKSYIAGKLAAQLGYNARRGEVIGPITVGADAAESDIIGKMDYDVAKKSTRFDPEAVAKWIPAGPPGVEGPVKRRGRLFIVDEANLANPQFWNFLKAFFASDPKERCLWVNGERRWFAENDRIIFTGNQETVTGRKFQELFGDYVATVDFHPFDDPFLREALKRYMPRLERKDELIAAIIAFHRLCERMTPRVDFSLRDIQEFAARAAVSLGKDWTMADAVNLGWELYRGNFTAEEAEALRHLIAKKFGADVVTIENQKIERLRGEKGKSFRAAGVSPVKSAARMAGAIDDFLRMRDLHAAGKMPVQGKKGMIFEGPSGRGKDLILLAELAARGFVDEKKAPPGFPAGKTYRHVNASASIDELVGAIEAARKNGSIIVVSEMNLLPTAFLEGKLNDVLTGAAADGFALFATINTLDFSGRQKLSTALQNRVIYQRIDDYTQDELLEIAMDGRGAIDPEAVRMLVAAQSWIRSRALKPNRRPTTREVVKSLDLMRKEGIGWRDAVKRVYGPYYLSKVIKADVPSDQELADFREEKQFDDIEVMRLIAEGLMPAEKGTVRINKFEDADAKYGGAYNEVDHSITLNRKSPPEVLFGAIDHEAGHGLATRSFPGLTPGKKDPLWGLYMWLEDARQGHALIASFPYHAGLREEEAGEREFAAVIRHLDPEKIKDYLFSVAPREIFLHILSSYAKGFIKKEDVAALADVIAPLYETNIAALALRHLDTAKEIYNSIPSTLDEEEIQFKQYRALILMGNIREDFLIVRECAAPKLPSVAPAQPKEKPAAGLDAFDLIKKTELKPVIAEKPAEKEPVSAPLAGGIDKSKIETAKNAMRKEKEATMAKSDSEVKDELARMEADLAAGSSLNRLREMKAQLENRLHPQSLVDLIEASKEDGLKDRADKLRREIAAATENLEREQKEIVLREYQQLQEKKKTRAAEAPGAEAPPVEPPDSMTMKKSELAARELAGMEEALKEGASMEQLEEMKAKLEEKDHIRSVAKLLEDLPGDKLNRRVKDIREAVNGSIQAIKGARADGYRRPKWYDGILLIAVHPAAQVALSIFILASIYINFGPAIAVLALTAAVVLTMIIGPIGVPWSDEVKTIFGEMSVPTGQRYPLPVTHAEDEDAGLVSLPAAPPVPRPVEVPLSAREKEGRDPAMSAVTNAQRPLLDTAVQDFFKKILNVTRVYGLQGTPDAVRIARGNLLSAFYKSGGVEEKTKKEIVVSGTMLPGDWNPVLEEACIFLFQSGFQFTVYLSADSYVEGVRTLSDLKRLMHGAEYVPPQEVEKDLDARKRREDFAYLDMKELQKKVEAVYLYGACANIIRKPPRPGYLDKRSEDWTFEDQVEAAMAFLDKKGIEYDRLKVVEKEKSISLNLSASNIRDEDLAELSRFKDLVSLRLDSNDVKNLSGLGRLPRLRELNAANTLVADIGHIAAFENLASLNLTNLTQRIDLTPLRGLRRLDELFLTGGDEEEIYKLFRYSKNREKLHVMVEKGGLPAAMHTYHSIPSAYKVPVRPLSFDEQVKTAEEFFKRKGIDLGSWLYPGRALYYDRYEQFIHISLSARRNISDDDLYFLSSLTYLTELNLQGTRISDLEPLFDLPNLETVFLSGSDVSVKEAARLLRNSPNREGLKVYGFREEEPDTYDTFPAVEKHAEGLTYEEQKEAARCFLEQRNLPVKDRLGCNDVNRTLSLHFNEGELTNSDLLFIASLGDLTLLRIAGREITTIEPLSRLKKLKHFILVDVKDLSPVSGMEALEEIVVQQRTFPRSFTSLRELRKLKTVSFMGTPVQEKELFRLVCDLHASADSRMQGEMPKVFDSGGKLIKYEDLPERYRPVSQELPVGEQVRLLKEFAAKNGIDTGRVKLEKGLITLDLHDRELNDDELMFVSGFTAIETLAIGNKKGSDLVPLRRLNRMTRLLIAEMDVVQVTDLLTYHPDGDKIEVFVGWDHPVKYDRNFMPRPERPAEKIIGFDEQAAALKAFLARKGIDQGRLDADTLLGTIALDLSGCDIGDADLRELAAVPNLIELDLSNTRVTDLALLVALKKLRRLSVEGCAVDNILPLAAIPRLEVLNLKNTKVSDIAPLIACYNLKEINLAGAAVSNEEVSRLFGYHPARKKLIVTDREGKQVGYTTPAELKPSVPVEAVSGEDVKKWIEGCFAKDRPHEAAEIAISAIGVLKALKPSSDLENLRTKLLVAVINSLVAPAAALEEARRRFAAEGDEAAFDELLKSIPAGALKEKVKEAVPPAPPVLPPLPRVEKPSHDIYQNSRSITGSAA